MNWFSLCVVLFIGGVSANSVLQPGRVFTYDYNTTIATGIPDVSGQYSIFTFESTLKAYPQNDGTIHFKMENVKVGEKNGEVPDMSLQWLNIRTEPNGDYERELSRPFTVKYSEGKVVETRFEKDEEIWSVDFKKGIADLFQIQKGQDRYENMPTDLKNRDTSTVAKYYRSKELSLIGKCEVQNIEESLPYPGKPEATVLNITKFHNSDNCNRTPEFYFSNYAPQQCTECDSDDATPWSHNLVTKINIELRDRFYFVEEIYREGVVKVSPGGTESDNFLSLYNQWLVLRGTSSGGSQAPQPRNAESSSIVSELENTMEEAYTPTSHSPSRDTITSITTEVHRLLTQMETYSQRLNDNENVKKILATEALIHKGLRGLPRDDFRRFIEEHLKTGGGSGTADFKTKMVFDLASRAGTKGAIEVLLKLIQDNRITDHGRIKDILHNIATHVVIPTTEIADIMLDFCSKNKVVLNSEQLQKTCYFSFAMLVSGACTGYSEYSYQPLPAERQCQRDKLKSYVTHVKHMLERQKDQKDEESEIAFTTVLGLMNVKDSIHALESRVLGFGTESDLVQITAIYALRPLAKTYPEQVRDLLHSVLYNSKERSETRIAAVAVLFVTRPPQEELDELALYTWHVEDQQLGAFIYSGLQALANVTLPCLGDLANYARHALDIANTEAEDGVQMGYHGIVDNMIDYLEAGYAFHYTFVGEAGSYIPSIFRVKLQKYLAGYFNTIFEFTYAGIEMKDIFDKLFGPANMYNHDQSDSIWRHLDGDIVDQGLKFINEKLGIKVRSSEESRAIVMFRLLQTKVFQYYFNVSQIAETFARGGGSGKFMDFNGRFNYHKSLLPFDFRYATPSAAGHHLHLDVKLPVFFSAKGDYSVKVHSEKTSEAKVNIKLNAEPTFAAKLHIKFGPVLPNYGSSRGRSDRGSHGQNKVGRIPYSSTWGKHYAVGYHSFLIIRPHVSGRIEGQFSLQDKTFRMSFQPAETSGQQTKEHFYYETQPYTVIYPREELKPIRQFSKPMRLMDTPYKFSAPFGWTENSAFRVKGVHEDEWFDRANIMEAIQERGWFGFASYWFLTQRMRMRTFTIEQTSQQQKYDVSFNWAYNPAESDPKFHPKNIRQALWAALSGWGYVPEDCSDADSSSSKPWEYQHGKLMEMTRSSYGSQNRHRDHDNYGTTSRPWNRDGLSGSSESSEESHWNERSRYIRPYSDEDENSGENWRQSGENYGSSEGYGWSTPSSRRHGSHRGEDSNESGQDRYGSRHGQSQEYGHGDRYGQTHHGHRREQSGERDDTNSGEYGNTRTGGNAPHRLTVETVQHGKGTATLHVTGSLAIKGQRDTTYGFDFTVKTDRSTRTKKVDAKFYNRGGEGSFDGKMTGFWRFPKSACYFGSNFRDDQHQKITGDVEFSWGSNNVNFNVTVSKSRDQQKYDQKPATDSNKPWFYEQCERDRQRGFLNSDACQRVMGHKNELHRVQFDVDYTGAHFSPYVRKAAVKFYKFLMHVWYNHMTEDVEEVTRPGKASFVFNFNYTMPVVDVTLRTNRETTYFENVYYGEYFPYVSPPSTRQTFMRQVAQYFTNEQAPASCLSSGQYMNTYDNNTWELGSAGNCPYLVTKDCTSGNTFYILLKNNNNDRNQNDKTLIVGVLKHTIRITPRQSGSNNEVVIDGEGKQVQNKQIMYIKDPAHQDNLIAYVSKTGPIYNVMLPYLGVRAKFDGNNLKVQVSHFWSNKLCGMCGEFRGSELYDLIGPQECAHATERDLLTHYTLREGSCTAPSRGSSNKLCHMGTSSSGSSPRGLDVATKMCMRFKHYIVREGDNICFTQNPHPQCLEECEDGDVMEPKTENAYCVKSNTEEAERLMTEVRKSDANMLRFNYPIRSIHFEVPTSCKSSKYP